MPSTKSIYSVLQACAPLGADQDYWDRMMHPLPQAPLVQREAWILDRCRGQEVVHVGSASGTLHARLASVASTLLGVDRAGADYSLDLDHDPLPAVRGLFLLADVLEHLGNPLRLLEHLRRCPGRLVVTVPNCNTAAHVSERYDNVNATHVAWYSAHTIQTLITRAGWVVESFAWTYRVRRYREGIALTAR